MNYWVAVGQETSGPFPVEEIESMLQQGSITAEALVMPEGEEEWRALSTVIDLGRAAPSPPSAPQPPPAKPIPTLQGPSPMQVGGTRPATQPGGIGRQTVYVAQPSSTTPVLVIFAVILVIGGAAAIFVSQRNQRVRGETAAAQASYDAALAKVEEAAAAAAPKTASDEMEVSAVGELMPALSVVNGAQSRFHRLLVKVTAYGGNAADAYAVGAIVAEPIVIAGESHEMEKAVAVEGFEVIDRSAEGAIKVHPQGGVAIEIDYGAVPGTTTHTGPLKGSVTVLAGGIERTVTIDGLSTRESGPIEDTALSMAGLSVKFTRANKEGDEVELGVELSGENAKAFVALELLDAKGNKLEGTSVSQQVEDTSIYSKSAPASKLEGAVLTLRLRDGAQPVEIPFDLKSVEVSRQ